MLTLCGRNGGRRLWYFAVQGGGNHGLVQPTTVTYFLLDLYIYGQCDETIQLQGTERTRPCLRFWQALSKPEAAGLPPSSILPTRAYSR